MLKQLFFVFFFYIPALVFAQGTPHSSLLAVPSAPAVQNIAPTHPAQAYYLGAWQPTPSFQQHIAALVRILSFQYKKPIALLFVDTPDPALFQRLSLQEASTPFFIIQIPTQEKGSALIVHSTKPQSTVVLPSHPKLAPPVNFSNLQNVLEHISLLHTLLRGDHPEGRHPSLLSRLSDAVSSGEIALILFITVPALGILGIGAVMLFFVWKVLETIFLASSRARNAEQKNYALAQKYPLFFKELARRSQKDPHNFDYIFELFDKTQSFAFSRPPEYLLDPARDKPLLLEAYYAEALFEWIPIHYERTKTKPRS